MRLQILIPQYNETDEQIKPLLDSIAVQQNVDFDEIGVIICNDGSDTHISKEFIQSYPYRIECWQIEHGGVSATRNALLDIATADYIMWCDADDMFVSACGLYLIFRYIELGFDALYSRFYEETRVDGKPVYVQRENDATFVHGKVYNRKFLIDNELRWCEKLKIHEDCFFNGLALNVAQEARYCDDPFYLWRWRSDSVCRNDEEYRYETFVNLIDSYETLIAELVRRGYLEKAAYFVCYSVFDTYYAMNKPQWVFRTECRDATEKRFSELFAKYENMWHSATMQDKMQISEQCREKALKEGLKFVSVTLMDWLNKIGEMKCQAEGQEKDSAEKR